MNGISLASAGHFCQQPLAGSTFTVEVVEEITITIEAEEELSIDIACE